MLATRSTLQSSHLSRHRPLAEYPSLQKKSTVNRSDPTGACPAATGAQLSREDAEFLAREAARADAVVAGLKACQTTYRAATDRIR